MLAGVLVHGILVYVFEALGVAVEATYGREAGAYAQYEEDVNYARAQGKRFERAKQMFRDPESRFALLTLGFMLEPLRGISAYLMAGATQSDNHCRKVHFFFRAHITSISSYL